MSNKQAKDSEDERDPIVKRLDSLIRIVIETLYTEKKKKFNEGTAIQILDSCDLTPTEIAKIMGKSGATAISPYLYSKDKPKRRKKKSASDKNDKKRSDK